MSVSTLHSSEGPLEHFSTLAVEWTGRSSAFLLSLIIVIVWGLTGPLYHYSDAWQLVINSITNIVTFVMVFVIQRAQIKDALATQLKLNELIAALHGASNRMIAAEDLSEDQLRGLHDRYLDLAARKKQSLSNDSKSQP
jgi:low affinity Fe/Cu permease